MNKILSKKELLYDALPGAGLLLVLFGVYLLFGQNYLLFHSLAEVFSVVIAFAMFMVAWHSRAWVPGGYLLVLGVGYLSVAFLDLLHMLSFTGMGVLYEGGGNTATQLWIAARAAQALALLIFPLFVNRPVRMSLLFSGWLLLTGALLASIFAWHNFPICYAEGRGLTDFKIGTEYVLSALMALSVLVMVRQKQRFDPVVLALLGSSVVAMIMAELAFTFYFMVSGTANMSGHLLKVLSFYLLYKALVVTGFTSPYRLLFRDLKASELSLQKALAEKEILLKEIHHRVKNNLQVISSLFHLQARRIEDKKTLSILEESRNRIHSIALVHDKLYRSPNLKDIDLKEYLSELVRDIVRSYGVSGTKVDLALASIPVGVDTAIPCGLIMQELVSNAIKYGSLNGDGAQISISLERKEEQADLMVRDRGPGFNEASLRQNTLGMRLIEGLAKQLRGRFAMNNDNGAVGRVTFPILEDR